MGKEETLPKTDLKKLIPSALNKRRGRNPNGLPKGIYNNFGFEFFNAVFWQCLGTPLVLFIRQSGGSAFAVGLISALPLILMPFTLASSRYVEKLGWRRTAVTFWTLRWVLSSTLIIIALINIDGFDTWRATLALLVLVMYHFCRNFGMSGYLPWLTAIIPNSRRGLYLSRATFFSNLGSIFTFLLIGVILGTSPALATFALVFGLGTVGGFISSLFMYRIAPPVQPTQTQSSSKPKVSFLASVKLCFARPGFKTFALVQTFYGIAFFGVPSLSIIYLREKIGFNPSVIIYFSTAGVVGATIAAIAWGRWIDRRQSVVSLQLLAFCGLCINAVIWVALRSVPEGFNLMVAATLMFMSAIWVAALNMSQTHSIMTLAPQEDRVMFQNIATLITYCSQALAPTLWGIMLDIMDHNKVELNLGFYTLQAYQIFYAATLVIGLCGAGFIYRRLPPKRAKE